VREALYHEEEMAGFWLQPETKPKMLKIVENELITKKAESVVDKQTGCDYMFENSRLQDLNLMYSMFKRDPQTLGLIIQKMNPYIEKRGEAIVNDEVNLKDPITFTQKLLNLKAEMDTMLKESFDNSMLF
jgi:hypothetical protein